MRAILDIDEIRQFNSSLAMICGMMRERKDHINHEFKDLNEVWQDANYQKFEQVFTVTVAEIDQFLLYAEMYSDYLQKKAAAAERFLEGAHRGRCRLRQHGRVLHAPPEVVGRQLDAVDELLFTEADVQRHDVDAELVAELLG